MKYISICIATIWAFSSCGSLEENPPSVIKEDVFYKTVEGFNIALTGVYSAAFRGYESSIPLAMTSGAEDMKSYADVYKNFDNLSVAVEEPNTIVPMWSSLYKSIANANNIIGQIDNIAGIPDEQRDIIKGQALFLRAMCFFYLVRWFGEVQLTTYDNQAKVETLKQASVADIYTSIVDNLREAEEKLPSVYEDKGRPTKWAAKALLAKVYLTIAGWPLKKNNYYDSAKNKAQEVMSSGIYSLEQDFADLWKNKNRLTNKEFIFCFYGSTASGGVSGTILDKPTMPARYGGSGWGDFSSEARFYNSFPDGYRKNITFIDTFPDGSTAKSMGVDPYIAKYKDAGIVLSSNKGEGTFVILRYADVLLMYAEAANMAEGAPSPAAYDAINKTRLRAGLQQLPRGLDRNAFDSAVIAERNWELAGEANRWFDLVRKDMVTDAIINRGRSETERINVAETDKLFPKPIAQLIPGIVIQNPGY